MKDFNKTEVCSEESKVFISKIDPTAIRCLKCLKMFQLERGNPEKIVTIHNNEETGIKLTLDVRLKTMKDYMSCVETLVIKHVRHEVTL